jgi:hypothetical protein
LHHIEERNGIEEMYDIEVEERNHVEVEEEKSLLKLKKGIMLKLMNYT